MAKVYEFSAKPRKVPEYRYVVAHYTDGRWRIGSGFHSLLSAKRHAKRWASIGHDARVIDRGSDE